MECEELYRISSKLKNALITICNFRPSTAQLAATANYFNPQDGLLEIFIQPEETGFFYIKGILEGLFSDLKVDFKLKETVNDFYDKTASIEITVNGENIGSFGEVSKRLLKIHDIKNRVFYAEINLLLLEKHINLKKEFKGLPKFPANKRDISFIVTAETFAGDIKSFIESLAVTNLEKVEIIDFYKGDKVETGKKSVTYSLTYRDAVKTLTDQEVETTNKVVAAKVIEKFKADIRQH